MLQVGLLVVSIIVGLLINVLFCLTLVKTLNLIKPENRLLQPRLVWLLLIPIVNLVWNFVVVFRLAESINKELESRNYETEGKPGLYVGLAYAILVVVANIPMSATVLGFVAIAALFLFAQYWMKIVWYKKILENDAEGDLSAE